MDLDDLPIGRVLTRREALAVLGSTGSLLLLGGATRERPRPRGRLAPETPAWSGRPVTAGPYYVDEKLERSDIRSDPTDGTVKEGPCWH